MLDAATKTRIDSARDILVGKVPDPKSQVEQITIALIYKFMDDMDRQSEELGGKGTFFSGEFKTYAWNHLLDKRIGGHERLLLYAEGIEKMNTNKNIPQLFRDIFRGVFLPYRDPETLNLFLKEINGFTYDHSERLGDAFEYLLSVMDSQGDAGQFRTPRHIIDFVVKVVGPQKNETILDPACGTAGFLISSYKHILAQNSKDRIGDLLTTDERSRLMTNFCGYDISPDMVRLSRVNLYLHGFAQPRIHEYDTLTSEERWDERYDVIMANPPFMTPKGGIRPHNRFSIKATRSEVLFVDYMAEHLNPAGRAGIIVPEGIIFQGQNAYKSLRRMLVENYLWAVVSLPAGVFNPYSGVKTSILFLDRSLSKRTDEILFVKVENDGFDLGAQRRPIEKNDLPEALKGISDFRSSVSGSKKADADPESAVSNQQPVMTLRVPRKRLLDNPDCNLSGDRYRETPVRVSGKWPMAGLGHICTFEYGKSLPEKNRKDGPYPVVGSNGITGWHDEYLVPGPLIVVGRKGSAGEVVWIEQNCYPIDTTYFIKLHASKDVLLRYLYYVLKHVGLKKLKDGAGIPGINRNDAYSIEIPLPPLSEQERIVAELDGYRKVIEGARQIIANYKPTIRIDPQWPMKKLAEVCEKITDGTHLRPDYQKDGFVFLSSKNVVGGVINWSEVKYVSAEQHNILSRRARPQENDILLAKNGTTGIAALVDRDIEFDIYVSLALLRPSGEVLPEYLWRTINAGAAKEQFDSRLQGIGVPNLHLKEIKEVVIPVPPLDIQRRIVASLDAERALVESNRKLIEIFEGKIKTRLDEIWGENR